MNGANGLRVLMVLRSELLRRGMRGMLGMLPEVTDVYDGTEEFSVVGSVDVVIVSPPLGGDEERACAAASTTGAKVMLLLRDSDEETIVRAATVPADGFLLESELTSTSLRSTLTRTVHGDVPMPPLLAHALLRRLQPPPASPPKRPFLLTPRELQAVKLLVEGSSNKQIGRRLGISENGAKRHVANILAKLNCPNRTLAAALVLREGLLNEVG
ncbi:MAG TPA: response regulator transcription factor [Micromonosporaceae bacterium]|nr:response regulator transcription factor [Micromonosporaceae bacterium]